MKVPFRLRRAAAPVEADALLVSAGPEGQAGARPVLEVLARARGRSSPRVHAVAGGFLVRFSGPVREPFPGSVRLRALAPSLYVPIDATLEPTLLEDEARGLVRERGLVFLPGGRTLAYEPERPLDPSALLDPGRPLERRRWASFEAPPPLAASIGRILVHEPPGAAERVLESGGEGIAEQPPEPPPPSSDAAASGAGKVTLGAGKLLSGLGKLLGSEGLAGAGADMIRRALEKAPGLAGNVLGRQEAALRELLRKFKDGEIDEALKRALPIGGPGGAGAGVATGSDLPTHDTRYSLGNVLDKGKRGPARVWVGADDIQRQLAQEYRKAAERARKQGDHRRAAFIYAKLLRDYRAAAEALLTGGLAHDAAVLYLETGDTLSAARAFEAAGELDRAVELYRRRGEHVTAGDLLRRLGDEEAAVAEYEAAAARLVDSGQHVRASHLLLEKARRRDRAIAVLEEGWRARPRPEAISCALHLPGLYVQEETPGKLLALVGEAEATFEHGGHEAAALQLWNGLARLAAGTGLESVRDDVLDRSRLGLARLLKGRAARERRSGDAAAQVFVPASWSPSVVSDAAFALADTQRRRRPETPLAPPSTARLSVGTGVVTAVAWARGTGEVFLGFERGDVLSFRPVECDIGRLCTPLAPVTGLACTDDGEHVVILRAPSAESPAPTLESCVRAPHQAYRLEETRSLTVEEEGGEPRLVSTIARNAGHQSVVVVQDGHGVRILEGTRLVVMGGLGGDDPDWRQVSALALLPDESGREHWLVAYEDGGYALLGLGGRSDTAKVRSRDRLGWKPASPGSLAGPVFATLRSSRRTGEVAAVTQQGAIVWRRETHDKDVRHLETASSSCREGYLAAALLGPGLVAGVTATAVYWLRASADELVLRATSEMKIGRAIAAFPSERTRELIVVTSDGFVVRVAVPS